MGFLKKALGVATGGLVGGHIGSIAGALSKSPSGGSGPGALGLSAEASKEARKRDFAEGLKKGKELIGEGTLGRLGTDPAIAQALEMQRKRLGGLTGAEMQAERDVAGAGINRATELARRRLASAQAQAGLRGATAAGQQADVLRSGIEQQSNLERQLMMGQRAAQREAISDVLGSGAQAKQFDISQAARERFGQLQTALGFQQLGVSERAGVAANQASVAAAKAAAPRGGVFGAITGK
jgi:hypothetical protein